MTTEELQNLHVGILGFARQGRALARWLVKRAGRVTVSDRRTAAEIGLNQSDYPLVNFCLEDSQDSLPANWDLICVSGGVPREHPYLQAALANGVPITNDAQMFFERCPAPILGITGSAGKTTTTLLVRAMLRAAGQTTWVGGNIGHVLLDDLGKICPEDIVVMELSSFQLEWMHASPATAAILNITPNHLDRHGTMAEYAAAKERILRWQNAEDWSVFPAKDENVDRWVRLSNGRVCLFHDGDEVEEGAYAKHEWLYSRMGGRIERVCKRAQIRLPGLHNVRNVLAAMAISSTRGLAVEDMARAICNFQPVAHRLQPIAEVRGVHYINDSIATSPERVLAALRSFEPGLLLLLGGRDKHLPWQELLREASERARAIIVFGEAANLIEREWRKLAAHNAPNFHRVGDLPAATVKAAQLARAGDIVLLSPGGTSYDAYPNFEARGKHFHELVMSL